MLAQEPVPLKPRKQERTGEAPSSTSPKRQKFGPTRPVFRWDKLSRVPLCRRALREFERRAAGTAPSEEPCRIQLTHNLIKELKRFARRGGPDCQNLIGYPEWNGLSLQPSKINSRSSRSVKSQQENSNSTLKSTKTTTLSSKDLAFEQRIIDYGILMEGDDEVQCQNMEAVMDKIKRERSSLSPSQFPRDRFLAFKEKNREARSEDDVKDSVMPMLIGSRYPRVANRRFANIFSMTEKETSQPQPDYYEGAHPPELHRKVREDLSKYIIPGGRHHDPLLPNHFTEVKGPDGNASEMRLQATYDAAHGTRAMHQIHSYGQQEQQFDSVARSFASTYHSGTGTLQLYASHAAAPTSTNGHPTYNITQLRSFALTDSYDTHRAGLAAYRNMQDLAKQERDDAIAYANEIAQGEGIPNTIEEFPDNPFISDAYATSFSAQTINNNSNPLEDKQSKDFGLSVKRSALRSKATSSYSKRSRVETAQRKDQQT